MLPRRGGGRGEYSEERGRGYRGYGNPQNPYNQPQGAYEGRGGGRRGSQDARYGEEPEYGQGRGGRAPGRGRGPGAFQGYGQGGMGPQSGRSSAGGSLYEGGGGYGQPTQYQQGERGRRGRGRGRGGGGQYPHTAGTFEAPTAAMQHVPTPERLATRFENLKIERVEQQEHFEHGSSSGEIPVDVAASLLPLAAPSESAGTLEESRKTAPVSSKAIVALSRPGFGVDGTKALIRVNHFKVDLSIDRVFHYDVDIQPQISSKPTARRLINSLVASYRSVELANRLPVYDGSKSMFSAGPFAFENKSFNIQLLDERGQSEKGSGRKERVFKVTIKHVATLDRRSLDLFLEARQTSVPQDFVQALDIVLREGPSNFYVSVGRSFFHNRMGVQRLDGGLVGWTGFYQSLRPTMQGLALNVDLATTAFYEEMDVIDFLGRILPRFNPHVPLSGSDKVQARKLLMRLRVEVTHRETSQKYRIAGLSDRPTNAITFDYNGKEEYLMNYFYSVYGYKIKFPELPGLIVHTSKGTCLPMEVCRISSGQKYRGKLSDTQTTNILRMAAQKPAEREGAVLNILRQENAPGQDQFSREFGIEVTRKLTEVQARVLPPPKLRYGGGPNPIVIPQNGQWNLMQSKFVEGARIENWALLDFSNSPDSKLDEFAYGLVTRCGELGLIMNNFPVVPFRKSRLDGIESVLKRLNDDARRAIGNRKPERLQLIVCLMRAKSPLYAELKRVSETEIGVVTQCCLTKVFTAKGGMSQYLANLAMKINVKAGGKNVVFLDELPKQLPNMFGVPTIIFGADVTHPVASDDSSPSIAAVVANVDWPTASKYISRVSAQKHREEIIVDLEKMVRELLFEYYKNTNSRKPERIIFFRDGVSEGQFYSVLHHEFDALLSACKSLETQYRPRVTWVVLQKRHHTRFIPADRNVHRDNVLPGTIVDRVITHPREFDFYLCSHAGIQGTSRPTHYHILWDENQFKVDELQGLINNLCYTYARCTKAVSIVPPAYYAHLVAYRARLYVDGSGSGSDTTSVRGGNSERSSTSASGSRALAPAVQALPPLQRDVQSVMYYC